MLVEVREQFPAGFNIRWYGNPDGRKRFWALVLVTALIYASHSPATGQGPQ